MKRLTGLIVLLGIVIWSAPAWAQMRSGGRAQGPYVTGSAGAAVVQLDLDQINVIDDATLAWKVGLGYRTRNFAVELDYRSLRELVAAFPGSDITSNTNGVQGSLLLILPVGPLDIFGRAGMFRWTHETGLADAITETKGTDLAYGAGIALRIGTFSLRAEYERFEVEALRELQMLTAGIVIGF